MPMLNRTRGFHDPCSPGIALSGQRGNLRALELGRGDDVERRAAQFGIGACNGGQTDGRGCRSPTMTAGC